MHLCWNFHLPLYFTSRDDLLLLDVAFNYELNVQLVVYLTYINRRFLFFYSALQWVERIPF